MLLLTFILTSPLILNWLHPVSGQPLDLESGLQFNYPTQNYIVIKAQFHTHSTYSGGDFSPAQLVDMYKNAGYDCIAITDYNTLYGCFAGVEEAKAKGKELGMIVIGGQEIISQFPLVDYQVVWKHVTALFLKSPISYLSQILRTNEVKPIFDAIHAQNGLGIIAHSWQQNEYVICGTTGSPWWQFRDQPFVDGWEIFNWGPGMTSSEIDKVIEEDKVYLCGHDLHFPNQVPMQDEYTLLFCYDRTEESVKEALSSQRTVVYRYGKVYGTSEALELYRQLTCKAYANVVIKHPYRGDLIVDVGVGNPASPLWSRRVWYGAGGHAYGLDMTIDISATNAYLPPTGTNKWFLKVYDRWFKDQGEIWSFTITYLDKTYTSPDVPIPIYDLKTSYAYIKG